VEVRRLKAHTHSPNRGLQAEAGVVTTPPSGNFTFQPLAPSDLPMFHQWLQRPHVAQWWSYPRTAEEVESEYLPVALGQSTTRAYIAMLDGQPIGFIQSCVVLGSGDCWWEHKTDPGVRGIDQFLCNVDQLNRGLGSAMVAAFTALLLGDPAVTKIQTDPSPDNVRAIRSYKRAGFEAVREVDTPDGRALLMVKARRASLVAEEDELRL
jgi:RimJ/RimL family protein N-acetyltransferase